MERTLFYAVSASDAQLLREKHRHLIRRFLFKEVVCARSGGNTLSLAPVTEDRFTEVEIKPCPFVQQLILRMSF